MTPANRARQGSRVVHRLSKTTEPAPALPTPAREHERDRQHRRLCGFDPAESAIDAGAMPATSARRRDSFRVQRVRDLLNAVPGAMHVPNPLYGVGIHLPWWSETDPGSASRRQRGSSANLARESCRISTEIIPIPTRKSDVTPSSISLAKALA